MCSCPSVTWTHSLENGDQKLQAGPFGLMSTQPIKTYPTQAEPPDCSQELEIFRLSLPLGNSPIKGTVSGAPVFCSASCPSCTFSGSGLTNCSCSLPWSLCWVRDLQKTNKQDGPNSEYIRMRGRCQGGGAGPEITMGRRMLFL